MTQPCAIVRIMNTHMRHKSYQACAFMIEKAMYVRLTGKEADYGYWVGANTNGDNANVFTWLNGDPLAAGTPFFGRVRETTNDLFVESGIIF